MKQRPLTDRQLIVLSMRLDGKSFDEISNVLGIHPATCCSKYSAIRRGLAKDAYSNVPGKLKPTYDLFENLGQA